MGCDSSGHLTPAIAEEAPLPVPVLEEEHSSRPLLLLLLLLDGDAQARQRTPRLRSRGGAVALPGAAPPHLVFLLRRPTTTTTDDGFGGELESWGWGWGCRHPQPGAADTLSLIRSLMRKQDAALGRPCIGGSSASQQERLQLHFATSGSGPVECATLLLHLLKDPDVASLQLADKTKGTGEVDYGGDAMNASLSSVPNTAAKVIGYMNPSEMFMSKGVDVTDIISAIDISVLYWFFIHAPHRQGPSYRPDASADVVSCNFATQLSKMKCQCVLKQGSKCVPQVRELDVVNAKDHVVGKIEDVKDTVPEKFLPAQQRTASHCILDGKLSMEHTLRNWCLLVLQSLPSCFFIFRKRLPRFLVVESRQFRECESPAAFIMELSHEVHDYYKPRGSIQFLSDVSTRYVVPRRNGQPTHMVHLPLLLQPDGEPAESELDSRSAKSPLTANNTGDSHDTERQHVDAYSNSNVQSQQGTECRFSNVSSNHDCHATNNDSLLTPIFVRHISGEFVIGVNLDQSTDHLIQLYAQKTKTKIESQYFVYGRKILQPYGSLLSYGIERNTTVHVCSRLLGGVMTVGTFLFEKNNRDQLVTEEELPDGRISLNMTKAGCLFLSTWLKCFTRTHADSKTWDGNFTLDDFNVKNGHVLVINRAKGILDSSSMKADFRSLVGHINKYFCRNGSHLISRYPPYLENLTRFLVSLSSPILNHVDRLFIETHVSCVESAARGILLVMLRKKQKSLDDTINRDWTMPTAHPPEKTEDYVDFSSLSKTAVFDDSIAYAVAQKEPYTSSRQSTFRLMRDAYMHGPSNRFDKSSKNWKKKFNNDDGIELMIPAYNPDLLPRVIYNWIMSEKVDINEELLAAQVRCTCTLCHPAHSGPKGGGESSSTGKGKQSASSTQAAAAPLVSQPTTPGSSSGSQPPTPRRSFLDALRGQSSGSSQHAAPRSFPKQQSSSSGFSWQSSSKGKGKANK